VSEEKQETAPRPFGDRGQGRKEADGFSKPMTVRFHTEEEWGQVAALSPIQRTQACLLFQPHVLVDVVRILTMAGYELPSVFGDGD